MPIEIRELIVRGRVGNTSTQNQQPAASESYEPERRKTIRAAIEQMNAITKMKKER